MRVTRLSDAGIGSSPGTETDVKKMWRAGDAIAEAMAVLGRRTPNCASMQAVAEARNPMICQINRNKASTAPKHCTPLWSFVHMNDLSMISLRKTACLIIRGCALTTRFQRVGIHARGILPPHNHTQLCVGVDFLALRRALVVESCLQNLHRWLLQKFLRS